MLNRVMIIGRLGQDPQLKYSQTGSPICTFSVATDETFTDRDGIRQQRTEWFRVVVFQKAAENCSRYLHKGSLVYVEGSLQTRKWQDQQGTERSLVEIRAQRVDFLEKRSINDEYGRRSYGAGSQEYSQGESGDAYRARPVQPNRYNQGYPPSYEEGSHVFPQDAMGEALAQENPPAPSQGEGAPAHDSQTPTEGSEQSAMDSVPF